ncbi:lysophospholipase [Mycobacterium hodleri]|uniref:Lysophospholipase n=1 Tax=Mycolicibacterium hodleri TaxID=49897 RepID=A0A544W315_9MYCO|nr:alpha/beta fold hydrolase [Mycolicibacterium hodleri]TQR86626.1 lysophospholipase [Mycolicibacterium hodleri]
MQHDAVSTAEAVVHLMEADRFAEIDELRVPALRNQVSADALRDPWQELITTYGPVTRVGTRSSESAGPNNTMVKVLVTCERGAFAVLMAVDDAGGLQGLQFAPPEAAEPVAPWQPASYVDPASFTEESVTVDSEPWATPGTLSLPNSPRPVPAVVLLAGSGPADRDATIGRNKIMKDVAWGLASRGIAVLRFDKVTHTHGEALAGVTDFTVVDEYVKPAVAAIQLLREHPLVDATRVFVLGHSQGGTVAPRIAAAEPSVAGLVVLAGATQPLHHAVVRQYRYLAALRAPEGDIDDDPTIREITRQAALVDSLDLSSPASNDPPPLGIPFSYWLDLSGYEPVAVAAQLGKPMLIVQGGRDYQVTVTDDLVGWQTGLAGHPDVTIRVFPADNHLFFSGSGPSEPGEYEPAQHVDDAVVDDVAQWIHQHAGTTC